MNQNKYYTEANFSAWCIPLSIFSIFVMAFAVLSWMGIQLPFDLQTFEGSSLIRILTLAAGVLGFISGWIGKAAIRKKNRGLVKACAFFGVLIIAAFCAVMFLSDGHTNAHVWMLLGSFSIIPGAFGGYAIRLAAKGWEA